MARSPVTSLINQFNALTEEQQKLFLDMVAPEPEPQAKQRRQRRARSPRAQSISAAIAKTPKVETDANGAAEETEATGPKCKACGNPEDYQDHFEPSPFYHAFELPASSAKKRSGRKSAGTSSTANSGMQTDSAGSVVQEASKSASAGD